MAFHKRIRNVFLLLMTATIVAVPISISASSIDQLRSERDAKRDALQQAERRIQESRERVAKKQQEARTLADQIEIIEDNIQDMELSINRTLAEIEKTNSEIAIVEEDIRTQEAEITKQKRTLAEYIRSIHDLDQQSAVAVFLKYQTFSEALNESSTLTELQGRAQESLSAIQTLHQQLVTQRRELADFKESLESLKGRQTAQQDTLQSQRAARQQILDLTKAEEAEFQKRLAEARQLHEQAQASVRELEVRIREELRKQGAGSLPSVGTLAWPVVLPLPFGVSCEFRCDLNGRYPFGFPHFGLDIPLSSGTVVRAPADGYVARTASVTSYGNYIVLLHGDNVTTLYAHLSSFAVKEGQMVTRGTTIGYSGNTGFSTGPHLHFEVRVNNVPVNPRNYLSR